MKSKKRQYVGYVVPCENLYQFCLLVEKAQAPNLVISD